MKRRSIFSYVVTFFIVAGLSFPTPASSTILFYEDFEDALKLEEEWHISGGHGSQGLTNEQVRYGAQSYMFSLTRYDSGDYREELSLWDKFNNGSSNFTIGNEYWIGFSVFLADGYYSNIYILHHQYHAVPDEPPTCENEPYRNPVVFIQTKNGTLTPTTIRDSRQCTPAQGDYEGMHNGDYGAPPVGQWIDFVINIKWGYGTDGFLKIWMNGVLVTNRTAEGNCFNDDKGPYLKIGIYGALDQDQTMTIYYDELRIGDSNSSYSEVAPGDGVPTCMSEGYHCCNADDCQSGHHAEYDGDCAGQVCCEVCGSTCAGMGGSCCSYGQVCEGGSLQSSADCGDLCCVGGVCAAGYTIMTASQPPVIDGLLGEYVGVPEIEIVSPDTGAVGVYRLLWDETALYIAAEVSDQYLNAEITEQDGELWNDDSLEIMFDTLHDGGATRRSDDYKIIVNLQEAHGDWVGGGQGEWDPAYTSAVDLLGGTVNDPSDHDAGYTMEIAIPWSEWGIAAPSGGTSWGMDISLNDNVGGVGHQATWWNSTGDGMNDPDGWGTAVFSEELVCPPGYMDCNDDPADGCEVNTDSDVDNCGSCDNACASGDDCVNGECVSDVGGSPGCGCVTTKNRGDLENVFLGLLLLLILWKSRNNRTTYLLSRVTTRSPQPSEIGDPEESGSVLAAVDPSPIQRTNEEVRR